MAEPETREWCEQRGHPLITYNPWLDKTFCRCGVVVLDGEQPQDMRAKSELFHDHAPGDRCRCYLPAHAG
jgi:hypothetical protein